MSENTTGIETLADVALHAAARGAHAYLRTNNQAADTTALVACLKSQVKLHLDGALKDMQDAYNACGMPAGCLPASGGFFKTYTCFTSLMALKLLNTYI